MNRIVLTIVLVTVFVVASIFWENHVSNHTLQLIDILERAAQSLEKDQNLNQCRTLMCAFAEKWQRVHDTWETMIAHSKLMEIETILAQVQRAIGNEDRSEALMQLAALRVALKHLADSHVLSLENLL